MAELKKKKKKPKKKSNLLQNSITIRPKTSKNESEGTKSSKKSSKTSSTPKKSTAGRRSLDPLREALQVLVNQANERAHILRDKGIDSRAMDEATRTLKRQSSRVDDDELFRADLSNRRLLNREFARVTEFLNDYTSTETGAGDFASKLSYYSGAFGGQWQDTTGENYDTSRINEEMAKQAFSIYRKVSEEVGGYEMISAIFKGKESLVGYGSENLIIAIYDMVVQSKSFDLDEKDIKDTAIQMVKDAKERLEDLQQKMVSGFDYGPLIEDSTVESRQLWFQKGRRGRF